MRPKAHASADTPPPAPTRISVVTVCRNAGATIGRTLESFFAQIHPEKELLVVDGASTDATLAIARSFAHPAMTIISEPDGGLYDAMNKGLAAFTGEAVGFLNADDHFADPGALAAIAKALAVADVAYGDLDVVAPPGRVIRRWRSTDFQKGGFRRGWMPPHPTFYCRRSVAERVGAFNTAYRLAADYDFMLRALELAEVSVRRIDRVLVRMAAGGASSAGVPARLRHNLEALDSRRQWLGAGVVDYALLAKPLGKLGQFARGRFGGRTDDDNLTGGAPATRHG